MVLPGRLTPDTRTPAQPTPDLSTPGGDGSRTVSTDDVEIDSTGTTSVGSVDADRVEVYEVAVTPEESDFDFNVNVDGEPVFRSDQSPDAAEEERFFPDDEERFTYLSGDTDIEFEVTSASGEADATADVDVKAVTESE